MTTLILDHISADFVVTTTMLIQYSVLIRVKVVSIINYKSHRLVIEVDVIQQNYHNYRPTDSHYVSKAI